MERGGRTGRRKVNMNNRKVKESGKLKKGKLHKDKVKKGKSTGEK